MVRVGELENYANVSNFGGGPLRYLLARVGASPSKVESSVELQVKAFCFQEK